MIYLLFHLVTCAPLNKLYTAYKKSHNALFMTPSLFLFVEITKEKGKKKPSNVDWYIYGAFLLNLVTQRVYTHTPTDYICLAYFAQGYTWAGIDTPIFQLVEQASEQFIRGRALPPE